MDKNKIAQQAKKIMDNFVSALDNTAVKADFAVRREKNIRDESILKTNVDFSERMLKNAPTTKDNYIVAETLKNRVFLASHKSSISEKKKW